MTGRTLWWTRWAKGARRLGPHDVIERSERERGGHMQRHQEQRRADTSALVDEARGQMPELPPYVPEFDLAFMSQMLGGGAVRSEAEDPLASYSTSGTACAGWDTRVVSSEDSMR